MSKIILPLRTTLTPISFAGCLLTFFCFATSAAALLTIAFLYNRLNGVLYLFSVVGCLSVAAAMFKAIMLITKLPAKDAFLFIVCMYTTAILICLGLIVSLQTFLFITTI